MWVTERYNGRYQFSERYKDANNNTKVVSVTLSSNSAQAHKQAMKLLNQKIADKLNEKPKVYTDITFSEVAKEWIELKKKSIKASTIKTYEYSLDIVNEHIGDTPIHKLRAGTINRIFLNMYDEGLKFKTVSARFKLTKNVIEFAVDYGFLDEDTIIDSLKLEKVNVSPKREDKYLEVDEAENLFERMIEDDEEELADFFRLQMQTGMRYGELASVHLPDIDLVNKTIDIKYTYDFVNKEFTLPKSNKTRLIHINDDTVDLIKKIIRRRNLLLLAYGVRDNNLLFFSQDGSPLHYGYANNRLNRYGTKEKPLSTHIFRHTFITRMVENNVPSTLIAEHVGQSGTEMIERVYSHFTRKMNDDLKEAINEFRI